MTYCSNCGHEVETDDNFCENCGYPLSKPTSSEVNDEELPFGIIAGFNIFPKENNIIVPRKVQYGNLPRCTGIRQVQ